MSHRHKGWALFKPLLIKGLALGRHSFFLVFPLSLVMSALEFALQPKAQPTFVDATDWAIGFFFFLGLLALSAIHAGIVLQMNAARKGQVLGFGLALSQGIERGMRVFTVGLLYLLLVLIGLFLIFPGLYLGVVFYFAFFLVALQDYPSELAWYTKLKNYFSESLQIVRGHWWLMFGVLLSIAFVLVILEQLCFLLLQHHLVLATLFCVLARAIFLPFWYGWILVLLFELKKSH